jgi:4-amino-4-deoxy-L-arabinose transferase-like glycosyltransferase
MSASINNDILSILLYFTGFYFGIRWFKEGAWKNIVFSALAVGFGMMTKLSVGMIAFPLGFLFIVKLIRDLRVKSEKKEGGRSFLQLCTFGVICAPLGLWFQLRNYFKFGVPITYVLRADNPYQDLTKYTVTQRIFGFYGFPIEDFFMNLGSDGEQDYHIFAAQVKTALFGGLNCRDDLTMSMTGYGLLIVFLILIALSVAGFIYAMITLKKRER